MISIRSRWPVLVLAAALLAGALPAAADDGLVPPQDYTRIAGLSAPQYDVRRDSYRAVMRDGVEIAVEVTRPDVDGRWPTILVLGPYHGTIEDRSGTRFLGPDEDGHPVATADYFAPRGYAVAFADLRGTGRSNGCLDLMGPTDRTDAHDLVEWVAERPWSSGRVGMVGHSYPAHAAIAAAAEAPSHLVTIVASAGAADMYQHQFQQGVPHFSLVFGPLALYQALATAGYVTEAAHQRPQDAGCEYLASTLLWTDHVSGVETDWHRERDWRSRAAAAGIPVFAVQGVDDAAVTPREMEWFTDRDRRDGDKLWLGQWAHGHIGVPDSYPYPNDREEQWRGALHAWLDRHLQERDVVTGPPAEIFLNDRNVLVADGWPVPARTLALHPDADGGLADEPGTAAVASFTGFPGGLVGHLHGGPLGPTSLEFETDAASEPLLLLGTPYLRLRAAIDGPRVNLVGSLWDVPPEGRARRIGPRRFAINPELREGNDRVEPVVSGEVMSLDMRGVGLAHRLLPGHRLRLVVSSNERQHAPVFAAGSRVDVHLGGADPTVLELPVVDDPVLWDDPR